MAAEPPAPDRWLARLGRMIDGASARRSLLARYGLVDAPLPAAAAVVGVGAIGVALCRQLEAAGIRVAGLFDDDPRLRGAVRPDGPVRPVAAAAELAPDVPLILATHRLLGLQQRLGTGRRPVWPFPLLAIWHPDRFTPHPFYAGLPDSLVDQRQAIFELADRLADDRSRATLDAVVGFRLTLDARLLRAVLAPAAYFPDDLLCFSQREVVVDAGAFDGDSTAAFIRTVAGRFEAIVAVEPAPAPAAVLRRRFAADGRIHVVEAGLDATNGTRRLCAGGRRDAAWGDGPDGVVCRSVTLDRLPLAEQITFVKINIEGAEPEALAGGATLIGRRRPRLAVAAYHRPDHLFNIPAAVAALADGCHLWLRQHDGGIVETVLYAR